MKTFLLIISILFAINCLAQKITIVTTYKDSIIGVFQYSNSSYVSVKTENKKFKKVAFSEISEIHGELGNGYEKIFHKKNPDIVFNRIAKNNDNTMIINQNYNDLDQVSKLQYQHDYTRFCLKKYHDEKMTGLKLELIGSAVIAAGALFPSSFHTRETDTGTRYNDRRLNNGIMIGGGVVSLIGMIYSIDAEKWLKNAYVGPDGIGVRFKF